MTRKHFEWAASYLAHLHNIGVRGKAAAQAERAMLDIFTRFGPRFNQAKFLKRVNDRIETGVIWGPLKIRRR